MHEVIRAEDRHIDQLVELFASTSIFRQIVANNKLGLPYHDFMVRLVVKPLLQYTYVLVDRSNPGRALGAMTGAPADEIDAITEYKDLAADDVYRDIFAPLGALEYDAGFMIKIFAIHEAFRGKGLGKELFEQTRSRAVKLGLSGRLLLTVWSNNAQAIHFYHAMGMIITGAAKVAMPGIPPMLLMEEAKDFLPYAVMSR